MARLDILAELLPGAQTGRRWLDAGCGTGTLARWLAQERGATVTAIDASEQMLANAQSCPGVTYVHADMASVNLPAATFDGILCSSVLEYLEHPAVALVECARLLSSGGILFVSVPNASSPIRLALKMIYWLTRPFGPLRRYEFLDYSMHAYTASGISRLLSSAGFVPTDAVDFATVAGPFGLPLPLAGALLMAKAVKP